MNILFYVLIIVAVVFRFLFLESSPTGFFVDEAHGGLALACFSEHMGDVNGRPVFLFSDSLNGGNWGPVFLYLGGIWAKLFGTTIYSMRLMQAVVSLITIYFIFLIARTVKSERAGMWCMIAGLISPWSIQLGRMHWEAGFLPMFLAAGIYFAVSGFKSSNRMFIAGIMFALAAYSYPAGRLQAPLIILLLSIFLIVNNKLKLGPWLWMCASALVFVLPLGYLIFAGDLMGRGNIVGIYTEHYLANQGKEQAFLPIAEIFIDHFFKHLSLSFLVFKGDGILRHHSGFGGQVSWLVLTSFVLYLVFLLRFYFHNKYLQCSEKWKWAPLFFFMCFLVCFVPAAFTWDSIPHALRSIPGWIFAALFAGLAAVWLEERLSWAKLVLGSIAIIYFVLYSYDYVVKYPDRSAVWFDIGDNEEGRIRVETDDWEPAIRKYKAKPHENYMTHMRFWMTSKGHFTCKESAEAFGVWKGAS